jgi:hypothetical protein
MIFVVGLFLAVVILLFLDEKPVPAKAQAEELFRQYFELDHVRQESAEIFAELMDVAKYPERVGIVQSIGTKPSLSSQEELIGKLKENQNFVEQALAVIDANKFADLEVERRYEVVHAFYNTLFEFEDMALRELSEAENNEQKQLHLATILFERREWPAMLAADSHLREVLVSLATLYGLKFASKPYEDLFRERLNELDIPLVSDEVNTIMYPFTVSEIAQRQVVLSVSFEIPLSDKISISLEDPRGRIISSEQLAEYDHSAEMNNISYIAREESVIIIKLFPNDPTVMPIVGEWKLYVTAPVGSYMVIGMTEG